MRIAIVLALLAFAAPALAQEEAAPSPEARYAVALGRGLTAMSAGDRGGAASAFRDAVQLTPARPDAVCLLAEVQRAGGELAAALEGFRACARVAQAASDPRWTGRGMHGVASTLERMEGRLEEARTAWQEYVRFADGATAHASPEVGRARIQAIDVLMEQERVYAEVRQRITEREAERAAQREADARSRESETPRRRGH